MKYESQKIAFAYFTAAMILFLVQVSGGLLAGWIYVAPNTLSEVLPFNVVRMLHTNSLIVWLLLGFFGAAYFIIPEESEREIHSPQLAYLQLAILVLGTAGVVVTYVFDLFHGSLLLGKDGREFLEQPMWVKIGIVVAALIFLYNVSMTVLAGRKTAITNVLLIGLWGIALFFLFVIAISIIHRQHQKPFIIGLIHHAAFCPNDSTVATRLVAMVVNNNVLEFTRLPILVHHSNTNAFDASIKNSFFEIECWLGLNNRKQ